MGQRLDQRGEARRGCTAARSVFYELGLNEIIGMVAPDNSASIRVLEKVGMRYCKTEAQDNEPDALIYRIE